MKDVFEYLESRGVLLDPGAAAYLETQTSPLDLVRASMSTMREAPLIIALSDLTRNHAPNLRVGGSRGPVSKTPSGVPDASVPTGGFGLEGAYPEAPKFTQYSGFVGDLGRSEAVGDMGATGRDPIIPVSPFTPPQPARPPAGIGADGPPIEVLRDITGQSACVGELADFKKYFLDRYRSIKAMLRTRPELAGFTSIDRVWQTTGEVKIIGMVSAVRRTKNGHILIELDDETGMTAVLASANSPDCLKAAESVVQDEVIGVVGKLFKKGPQERGLVILNDPDDIVRPEVHLERAASRATRSVGAAFIGDMHFGSKSFLGREWDRFIEWINGRHGSDAERVLAKKVRYVVVTGDVVDGVGVYARQRSELAIPGIMDQYAEAARQLSRLPNGVEMIMLPGEHDAVRQAEPQPTFPPKVQRLFREGVRFVGNPCRFKVEGVNVLAYHGHGLDDYMTSVKGLSYGDPLAAMKEMVKRRHLCPVYGGRTPIAPEHKDHLVIDSAPDIFVTGHVHSARVGSYRGITLINSSAWQAQTEYQKMLGLLPEPARVPVVDLASGQATVMDFNYSSIGKAS